MRDPFDWALPFGRLFGVPLRVHVLYFVVTLALFLRLVGVSNGTPATGELFVFAVLLPFALILVHELGHLFAARSFGGDAERIVLWPLGGLVPVTVSAPPRAQFQVTLWGPLANLGLCVACALVLIAGRFSPLNAFNLVANPLAAPITNLDNGREYTGPASHRYYRAGTAEAVAPNNVITTAEGTLHVKDFPQEAVERADSPAWVVWVWRACWLSFWLAVVNLIIPAFPLDGGHLLHAVLRGRSDARTATLTCCYVGFGAALIVLMVAFVTNESLIVFLSVFLLAVSYLILNREIETPETATEEGYPDGSVNFATEDESPSHPPRRPGLFRRWRQARQIARMKQEHETAFAEEARMDDLLDKIARSGQHTLTDEERQFLERVSHRYRNRL